MDTQKIMRLADIYAERCNNHQRHATEETHHDMMWFSNALEAEATRLHSVIAELIDVLIRAKDAIEALDGTTVENEKLVDDYRATIAKAQEVL